MAECGVTAYCEGLYPYPYGPTLPDGSWGPPLPVETTYTLYWPPLIDLFHMEVRPERVDPVSLVSPAWRPLDDELDVLLPYEPHVAVPALYTTWTPLPSPLAVREASVVSEPYVLVLLLVGLVLAGWRRR